MDRIEVLLARLICDVGMLKNAHTKRAALRQADMIAEDVGLTLVRGWTSASATASNREGYSGTS